MPVRGNDLAPSVTISPSSGSCASAERLTVFASVVEL
jgi:hypothetical protein